MRQGLHPEGGSDVRTSGPRSADPSRRDARVSPVRRVLHQLGEDLGRAEGADRRTDRQGRAGGFESRLSHDLRALKQSSATLSLLKLSVKGHESLLFCHG